LPYPSLYDEGFHRLGCIICPFILGTSPGAVHQREESMRRWPGMWKAFKSSCRVWHGVRHPPGEPWVSKRSLPEQTFEEYYKEYLNGFEKEKNK
jgi:phosphoadenosine phosphosulfate reductase